MPERMLGDRDPISVNGTKNDGWRDDVVVNVPTTIIQVVKMKGQSLAVGSVEPKDLPICMH